MSQRGVWPTDRRTHPLSQSSATWSPGGECFAPCGDRRNHSPPGPKVSKDRGPQVTLSGDHLSGVLTMFPMPNNFLANSSGLLRESTANPRADPSSKSAAFSSTPVSLFGRLGCCPQELLFQKALGDKFYFWVPRTVYRYDS